METLPNELQCKIFAYLEKEALKASQLNKILNHTFNQQKNYIAYQILKKYNPKVIYGDSYIILTYFIKKNVNLNVDISNNGETLLIDAIPSISLAKYFIQLGYLNYYNLEPILFNACNGYESENDNDESENDNDDIIYVEFIKYLLEINPLLDIQEAFNIACSNDNLNITRYLIEMGANLHEDNDWVLRNAAERGNLKMVKLLVELGATINTYSPNGDNALDWACRNGGHLEMVKYLIEKGSDLKTAPSSKLNDILILASSENGDLKIVKYLVDEMGVDLHEIKNEALCEAAKHSKLDIINYLVENGADINYVDHNGYSTLDYALEWACIQTHDLEILKYLNKLGANLNMKNISTKLNGWILCLAYNGRLDIIKYLISEMDINIHKIKDDALCEASKGSQLDIIKYLVENGANVNHICEDGETALKWASINGNFEVAKYLVENGANVISLNLN
jgi:ankyrin repeat protein